MSKFISLIFYFVLVITFISCNNPTSSEPPIENKFIGTWYRGSNSSNFMQYSFSKTNVSFYGTALTTVESRYESWTFEGNGTWWVKKDSIYFRMVSSFTRSDFLKDTIIYTETKPATTTSEQFRFDNASTLCMWLNGWQCYNKQN